MNFNHFEKYLENFFNRPKIKDSKRGSVISKTEFGRKSFPFWKKEISSDFDNDTSTRMFFKEENPQF